MASSTRTRGSAAERQPLELLGQLDLALGRERGQRVVPQRLRRAGDAVGLGQAGPLVDGAERDVVAGLGEHLVDGARVERAGVGEPGAAVADDPHADALALGRHEVLDLALVDADLGLAAARDVGLDLLAGLGLGDDLVGERLQLVGCCRSRRGAADRERGDAQRRLAGADGHALAVLAARARTAHREVVADARRCRAAPAARCRSGWPRAAAR